MGLPLFTFEDEFISSMCWGLTEVEAKQRVFGAFEAGRAAMEKAVRERVKASAEMKPHVRRITVEMEKGAYVVVVPAAIEDAVMEHEMGGGNARPQPVLRSGVIHGAGPAAKAISDGLDLT